MLQVYQDNIDGVGKTELDHVRFTVGDTDDIEALVLAEQTSQPESEELFGRNDDDGDLKTGQRRVV